MITFENKEIEKLKSDETTNMCYKDFGILVLNSPVQQGMTVKDIGQRLKLIDDMKDLKVGETLTLTEEGYTLLSTCVENMKWGLVHESIPAFDAYITSLKPSDTPDLTEKPEGAKTESTEETEA